MGEVELTRGKVAKVDIEDFDHLSQWKWHLTTGGYAARTGRDKEMIYMHRYITKARPGMDTDHINGDRLDNRKLNLRVCTRTQNMFNQSRNATNKSGYKGVSPYKNGWVAQIQANNKKMYLGYFKDPEVAARVYNDAALKLHKSFARLNKIGVTNGCI